jgi:hypothetical protein
MEIEGGKEALREEIIADARFVYKSCMNRKHLRDDIYGRPMHPDVGGATKALALMLKAGGLDVQKHEVVTVDLASCIAQLPHEAREYIALHGELPPGVQLPGFQMRALPEVVPEVVEVVPNEPRIDTNEEAQSLSDEED